MSVPQEGYIDEHTLNGAAGNNVIETIRATYAYKKNIELVLSPRFTMDTDDSTEWGYDPEHQYHMLGLELSIGIDGINLSADRNSSRGGDFAGLFGDFLPEMTYGADLFHLQSGYLSNVRYYLTLNPENNSITISSGSAELYIRKNENTVIAEICNRDIELSSSSSRRYKHSIKPLDDAELDPHRLLKLKPVQFEYNADHITQYADMHGRIIPGLIAEDVDEVYPSATIHGKNGEIESWDERRIIPGMLALIQEQAAEIENLKKRLEALEKKA